MLTSALYLTTLLNKHFTEQIGLSEEDFTTMSDFLTKETLKAQEYFVREGHLCQKIGFITDGFAKSFYLNRDGEVINYFSQPTYWIGSLSSFEHQRPITYSVKAVTDCQLLTFSLSRFREFCSRQNANQIWEKIKTHHEKQTASMKRNRQHSIKEQYETFVRNYPDLAFALSLEDIAAFLEIPQQELVKILWKMVTNQ